MDTSPAPVSGADGATLTASSAQTAAQTAVQTRAQAAGEALAKARLPLAWKWIYAVGSLGLTILISAIGFFLLIFYTDVALVPPALASTALLVAKIWDTVNDPLFGWLSDRTRSRFGRRRIYLIVGALPLALATYLLWSVPAGLSAGWAFAWIALTYIIFDTFFTIVQVPMNALAAEITPDYDERTSLLAYAGVGAVAGYLLGSILMRVIVGRFDDPSQGYAVAGAIFGGLVGLSVALVAWKIREPAEMQGKQSTLPILSAIRATFHNRPFVRLLAAFSLARISFTLLSAVLAYYVTYHLGAEGKLTLIILVLMLVIGLFIPVWRMLARRWSKGFAYGLGLTVAALSLFFTYFLPQGSVKGMFLIVAVAGFGLSAHWVLPWAMLPDVVEYDEDRTGQRREGMYYGVYGLLDKIARTIGIFAVGWVLDFFGYVPNVAQTARSLQGIRLLFGPVSAILLLLAVPLLLTYPITRASHQELRERLAAKRAATPVAGE